MRSKQVRQAKIRELLHQKNIETHEELAAVLARQHLVVSQSTLSKDLRELGVVRVPRPDGGFRYTTPEVGATPRDAHLLKRELRDYQVRVERAQNLVVLKTMAGHAQSVCAAIDHMQWEEIVGTIGGEDTILIVARTAHGAEALVRRLGQITGEDA